MQPGAGRVEQHAGILVENMDRAVSGIRGLHGVNAVYASAVVGIGLLVACSDTDLLLPGSSVEPSGVATQASSGGSQGTSASADVSGTHPSPTTGATL